MRRFSCFNILLLCTLLSLQACSSAKHTGTQKKLPGDWQQTPVVVDGDSKEWPSPYPNYDSRAKVGYATSNDRDNLYITVETGDEYTEMKILKAGLTVWIDTDGGKQEQMAINYPLQDDNDPYDPSKKDDQQSMSGSSMRAPELSAKIRRALSDATQLTIEGFPGCSGGFAVAQNNNCGIRVHVGIDEYKELIWEASIPFKAIYGKSQITKADEGKPISVCFAVKAFKKGPSTHGNDVSSGSMNSSMGGGRMGGGGGGRRGGMSGQENPRDHLFESTKTWKQFGLTYQ